MSRFYMGKGEFKKIALNQRARAEAYRAAGDLVEAAKCDAEAMATEAYVKEKFKPGHKPGHSGAEHMRKMRDARKPRKSA